jgi:hypothetical protein
MKQEDILRYNNYSKIYDGLGSKFIKELKKLPFSKIITISDKNTLDLIAYNEYFDYEYWWIIATYNNIVDPIDYEIPLDIKIPDYRAFQELIINYTKDM